MNKIAIVGDTSQDLTFELAKDKNIELVSYYIERDGQSLKDLVEINSNEFYSTIDNYADLKTGVPPIADGLELIEKLKNEGYTDVICIASSSKLTGMVGMYNSLKQMVEDINISIIDTDLIASAAGIVVIEAANLRDQGKSKEEIIEQIETLCKQAYIIAAFKTLKYLVKGGRFNKYKGMIGNLLNINPIITLKNGELEILDKVRGSKKSIVTLVENIENISNECNSYKLVLFHGEDFDDYENFKSKLSTVIENAEEVIETRLTSVLGVHTGPKTLGATILKLS